MVSTFTLNLFLSGINDGQWGSLSTPGQSVFHKATQQCAATHPVLVHCCYCAGLLAFGQFSSASTYVMNNQTVVYIASAHYEIWELPLYMVLGVMGGLLGALFIYLNRQLTLWRQKYLFKAPWRRMVEVRCGANAS